MCLVIQKIEWKPAGFVGLCFLLPCGCQCSDMDSPPVGDRVTADSNATTLEKPSPTQTAAVAPTRRRTARRAEATGTSTFWRRRPLLQRSQTCLSDADRKAKKKSTASPNQCPGGGSEDYWFLEPASRVAISAGAESGARVEERAQGNRKLRSADRNSKGGSCLFLSQCCCQTKGEAGLLEGLH